MSRRANIVPSVEFTLCLPEDLHAKVTLLLYSQAEARVPLGAYRQFYIERLREFFNSASLDLAPWAATDPGACIVHAPASTIEILKRTLRGEIPS
jgi:hypothetical protein